MKLKKIAVAALAVAALAGCSTMKDMRAVMPGGLGGWTTLVDGGKGLENFERIGNSNWRVEDGAIVADRNPDKTPSYLVTRSSYANFVIRAEFWASSDANSGIFTRCKDGKAVNDDTCYEANIFDQRPDPSYGTGAIVKVAKVDPMPKAGGKWNTYEFTLNGSQLTVVLNGQKTVDVQDAKLASGPLALQHGTGTIKWRKVEIRPL
jgi:3-keto-disaccharide hydrolase